MTTLMEKLHEFWSSFGLPAYAENSIPDDAVLPYITYYVTEPDWQDSALAYARVWFRDTSFADIASILDEIKYRFKQGVSLFVNGGCIYLFKDSNFIQFMPSDGQNEDMKIAYISMVIHAFVE